MPGTEAGNVHFLAYKFDELGLVNDQLEAVIGVSGAASS
ncbi:hypothetical protein WH7805_13128 [Synechococcus sp. WH 7805]|nr:hypothetical protein WH7805_13128 [Synechococcus sp. WH 7805]